MNDEIFVEILKELFDIDEISLNDNILFEVSQNDLKRFADIIIDKCQEIVLSKDKSEKTLNIISNINEYFFDSHP